MISAGCAAGTNDRFLMGPRNKNFVLSLGGSLIVPKEGIAVPFLARFKKLVARHVRRGRRFIIVCGGGATARTYQAAAGRIARPSRDELDYIGIAATALNAQLVRTLFGKMAHPSIITDPRSPLPRSAAVVIGAGWRPGCSTDYDAVLLAKKFGAGTVVNFSNITYVYDKDPRDFADAKPLKALSWRDYCGKFGCRWKPGLNSPFDPVAAKAAKKAGLKVIVADGRDLANIDRIIAGQPFQGTVIG